jgi:hypothetical protein
MSTHPTEFRTISDFRLQRDLERMREARNQRIAEREENYRRLPLPELIQPKPVNCCATQDDDIETWRDAAVFYAGAVACLAGWGLFGWAVVAVAEMLL